MLRNLFAVCLYMLITFGCQAQNGISQKNADSTTVVKQLNEFIHAFEDLDFDRFQTFFANDVTVFFPPSAMAPHRVQGKEKAMAVFKTFFQKVKEKKSHAPYLDITPKKLQIAFFQEIAIVTFELDDPDSIGRRTIILRKTKGEYLIVHLHASNIDKPK